MADTSSKTRSGDLPAGRIGLAGLRSLRWRLLGVLGVAVVTYAVLYAVTTWLGTFA